MKGSVARERDRPFKSRVVALYNYTVSYHLKLGLMTEYQYFH